MTALLLLGLLLADAPPDDSVLRPPVPVPEEGIARSVARDSRPPEWGFTAAAGMATLSDRGPGLALWAGVRRWLAPNFIAGGLVSYQQFDRLTNLALLARIELAAETEHHRVFPAFSAYAGAGPELFSDPSRVSAGLRFVLGTHLPSIWMGGLFPLLLPPTALEVQFRTGGRSVPPSTSVVVAIAL